ncbi:hypothetical protein GCM10009660_12710 [Catellatospora bangladeshensis]
MVHGTHRFAAGPAPVARVRAARPPPGGPGARVPMGTAARNPVDPTVNSPLRAKPAPRPGKDRPDPPRRRPPTGATGVDGPAGGGAEARVGSARRAPGDLPGASRAARARHAREPENTPRVSPPVWRDQPGLTYASVSYGSVGNTPDEQEVPA